MALESMEHLVRIAQSTIELKNHGPTQRANLNPIDSLHLLQRSLAFHCLSGRPADVANLEAHSAGDEMADLHAGQWVLENHGLPPFVVGSSLYCHKRDPLSGSILSSAVILDLRAVRIRRSLGSRFRLCLLPHQCFNPWGLSSACPGGESQFFSHIETAIGRYGIFGDSIFFRHGLSERRQAQGCKSQGF